jgi:hypothetical protein
VRWSAAEVAGLAILVAVGVGARLAFVAAFPPRPFWDFLGLIHFGALLRDHGLAAPGWYWSQFNPGLPVILSFLFRIFPGDQIAVARTATAVSTGLLPLFPFLLWRPAVELRWRLFAGGLLALWPGQVFFSGVVAQENWVLLPTVALASLAAGRLLGSGPARPVVAGLLYAGAAAIRQEMAFALLPVLIPAAFDGAAGQGRRRGAARLGVTLAAALAALAAQRLLATGRLAVTTEHGPLGLYGSFMPRASEGGWIDGRAYAFALEPPAAAELFGRPSTLFRMTREEIARRPAFHLLRMAAWFPRLAVDSDSGILIWSVGPGQAQEPERQARAARFVERWTAALKWELAAFQGLFLVAVAMGLARRNPAILVLSASVFLKFLVHAVVSPLARLIVPAIALELLVIALGMVEFARSSMARRAAFALLALAPAALLLLGVPRLTEFVVRRDSPVLPGVRRFSLYVEGAGVARCELRSGALTGLGPRWAALRTTGENPAPGEIARVACALPKLGAGDSLVLLLHEPFAPAGMGAARTVRVELDGRELSRAEMAGNAAVRSFEISGRPDGSPSELAVELVAGPSSPGARSGRDASIQFEFERRPAAHP